VFRVLIIAAVVSCKEDVHEVNLTREHFSRKMYGGVTFATVFERDANDQSPLLVMLHGRGDTPERFRNAWRNFPVKLQLSLPKAPLPFEHGWEWFDDGGDATIAEAALWPAMVGLAEGRKLMVGGIDQGAAVANAMAAHHPDVVTCVVSIADKEVTPETYDAVVNQVRECVQWAPSK
jgi:pimeloyl-ACP methyl ester carboxylesterase